MRPAMTAMYVSWIHRSRSLPESKRRSGSQTGSALPESRPLDPRSCAVPLAGGYYGPGGGDTGKLLCLQRIRGGSLY